MLKIDDLAGMVFAGLSALVIEDVKDEGGRIRVMARTHSAPVPCPMCGALTGRVHGYDNRTVTDVPIDGRRVVVSVQGSFHRWRWRRRRRPRRRCWETTIKKGGSR